MEVKMLDIKIKYISQRTCYDYILKIKFIQYLHCFPVTDTKLG